MKAKGFTLIELLVVITIIGILATGATALYTGSLQKARDNNRITDMQVYRTAINQVYDDNGQEYPAGPAIGTLAVTNGYIEAVIKDEKSQDTGAGAATSTLEYRYVNGDFNGVTNGAYEISTAFEAKGNVGAKGQSQTDQGADADRYEVGVDTATLDTTESADSTTDQEIS